MNRAFRTAFFIVLVFVLVVNLTAKIEKPWDGNNYYGYPLVFLTEWSEEVTGPPSAPTFVFRNFLIDLLPAVIVGVIAERAAIVVANRLKKRFNKA
ncbi:hypothetical protein ACQ86N_15555 [Puia sp. P3]|uniref:hypothetical protein n=1 Tax=Puia sp. P3 TaxID=3423952 RepID=UPI003D67378C